MRSRAEALVALLALAAGIVPATVAGADPIAYGSYRATGTASWYGDELVGNRTASGDRFDPDAMTAAHRTLPLGSFIEVTALDTGRTVLVRVNDRGPGRRDRLLDLSRGAARRLGIAGRPIASVSVRAIRPSPADAVTLRADRFVRISSDDRAVQPIVTAKSGNYLLRIASFSSIDRARELARRIGGAAVAAGSLWRVQMGPYRGLKPAQDARDVAARRGYGDAQILPLD